MKYVERCEVCGTNYCGDCELTCPECERRWHGPRRETKDEQRYRLWLSCRKKPIATLGDLEEMLRMPNP